MNSIDVVHLYWKDWGLHVLVLFSFTLQLTLLLLAEFRRRFDSGVLRAFIWSAYILADSIAIYTIGHLSATSQAAEHQAMALWAPLLLVHLGGQDNITAYAMEDNRLWLRHLQTLAVQATGAAYVLYVSLQEPAGDGRHRPLLRRAAILLFVVGVVKYGERVLALMRANSNPSGKSYRSIAIGMSHPCVVINQFMPSTTDTEALLQVAHGMLDVAKDLIKAPLPWVVVPSKPDKFRGDVLCRVAEMQLSLMHDVLYSKAEVIHTWYGLCVRVFSWVATACALFLFHLHLVGSSSRSSSSRKDTIVTYVLLAGAVVLETVSGLRIMLSTWTWHFLWNSFLLDDAFAALRRCIHAADYLPRTWSGSIGQHNLFQVCSSTAARPIVTKVAEWMGVEAWWNTFAYSHSARVSPPIKGLLVEQVLESVQIPKDSPSHIRNSRGRAALQRWASAHRDEGPSSRARAAAVPAWKGWLFLQTQDDDEQLGYWGRKLLLESVVDLEFVESILVWHIATDAYLCWYRRQQETQQGRKEEDNDLARAVQELSNYMLFLLAARPYMLPPPASRTGYASACLNLIRSAAGSSYIASADDLVRVVALEPPDRSRDFDRNVQVQDGVENSSVKKGSDICSCLIDEELKAAPAAAGMMLKLIAQVWLEMLCYAGAHCSAHSHAMQLSNGSELVTLAALLVRYCGPRLDVFCK
uniref:DUF4220 domain-containing protein n=1 Tax=Setaria italica TaxID=4555 RepID=K3YMX1_SETIT